MVSPKQNRVAVTTVTRHSILQNRSRQSLPRKQQQQLLRLRRLLLLLVSIYLLAFLRSASDNESLLVGAVPLSGNNNDNIFDLDYTCYVEKDYAPDNTCTIQNGVCDNPNLGGSGGDACIQQDCIDCNRHCTQFNGDCHKCVNARGCYYCRKDGTCENYMFYSASNKDIICNSEEDYIIPEDPDMCVSGSSYTKDPTYEGSEWMFEMINLVQTWELYGLTGKGIVVRINDDGVFVENNEFSGRFDNTANSCQVYTPNPDDLDGHGTAVAGILLGNANNNLCSVGIAYEATFSSCNFFAESTSYSDLAYKLETFDISQNSIGMPACKDNGSTYQSDIIYDEGCPFTFQSEYNPCANCEGEFATTDRALSSACSSAISKHCKYFYKKDVSACMDFPEIIIGGSCNYDLIPQSAVNALERGVTEGRNGKGTIFTFASGNAFLDGDDLNFSGWTNSRYTITVGAVGKDGFHSDYSSPGAALHVSAPAGDVRDIGKLMTAGLGVDTCADSGQGTSFSCPVVSGVIALMLEANPELTWRDVQGILAQSSQNVENDTEDYTQTVNGAGFWHSNWYGFGIVDAKAAVEAAMDWTLYAEEVQVIGISTDASTVLSDDKGNEFVSTIRLNPLDDIYAVDFVAESTVVLLDLYHEVRGDLEIKLESPSGTNSILHPGKRPENSLPIWDERWKLMTVKNWGESPTGNWNLKIRDLVDREDTFNNNIVKGWTLIVYGRSSSGGTAFAPTKLPTTKPTAEPTNQPTLEPTKDPTKKPTKAPTKVPTSEPTKEPSALPTSSPSWIPTGNPTLESTLAPTKIATKSPTSDPSTIPTSEPSIDSKMPTLFPTADTSNGTSGTNEDKSNLSCETAMAIQSNSTAVEGIIRPVPLLELDGPCLLGLETIGGWYQVLGNGNVFTMKACSTDISKSVGLSIFTGNCSQLECVEHHSQQVANCETGNGREISFASKPGRSYSILVSGLPVGVDDPSSSHESNNTSVESSSKHRHLEPKFKADYQLEFTDTETPKNSKCGSSLPVTSNATVEGSTVGLLTTYKTCHNTEKSGAWYSVSEGEPSEDGIIVFEANTCNSESNFYNTMSVFRGEGCGSHQCVDVNILPCPNGWFGHQVFWSTSVRESFQIFVHASDAIEAMSYGAGFFHMDLAYDRRLDNDQCATAFKMELNQLDDVNGTTSGAKPDMDSIENSSCEIGGAGAWYTVRGTGSVMQASTCSNETDHKTEIHVYSGECGRLTCIATGSNKNALCKENNASVVNFQTQVDVDYYVLVTNKEGNRGNFRLKITEIQPPENNECQSAKPLGDIPILGSTLEATTDFPPDYDCGLPLDTPGVWYEILGSGGGMEVSTCGSDFDSAISIFEGNCDQLKCVTRTSAPNRNCTDGQGVVASFLSEENKEYFVYVHGRSESSTSTGDFTVLHNGLYISLEVNEIGTCSSARSIPTDGSRIQVSTENNAAHMFPFFKTPTKNLNCGVNTTQPGLWYKFQGNGGSFNISACSEDKVDASVSIWRGDLIGCDSLLCVTGTTFVDNACSSAQRRRFLKEELDLSSSMPPSLQLMTFEDKNYYVFVHGSDGVGVFDLFVSAETLVDAGTTSASPTFFPTETLSLSDASLFPTETPIQYGKDLHRWIQFGTTEVLAINTDYLSLNIIDPPIGDVTTQANVIYYAPLPNYDGQDVMTVSGCNGDDCYRFNVTIRVWGQKFDPDRVGVYAGEEGRNKTGLLLWLLMSILLLCVCLPLYWWHMKKQQVEDSDDGVKSVNSHDVERSDRFYDDSTGRDQKGLDWDSSSEDDNDGSYSSSGDDDDDDDGRSYSSSEVTSDGRYSSSEDSEDESYESSSSEDERHVL